MVEILEANYDGPTNPLDPANALARIGIFSEFSDWDGFLTEPSRQHLKIDMASTFFDNLDDLWHEFGINYPLYRYHDVSSYDVTSPIVGGEAIHVGNDIVDGMIFELDGKEGIQLHNLNENKYFEDIQYSQDGVLPNYTATFHSSKDNGAYDQASIDKIAVYGNRVGVVSLILSDTDDIVGYDTINGIKTTNQIILDPNMSIQELYEYWSRFLEDQSAISDFEESEL